MDCQIPWPTSWHVIGPIPTPGRAGYFSHGLSNRATTLKFLGWGSQYIWPVHKPPRLEPSLTRRRGSPVPATDMTFPQRVAGVRLPKRLMKIHLTLLNVECTRGACINGRGVLSLHLPLFEYISFLSLHTDHSVSNLSSKLLLSSSRHDTPLSLTKKLGMPFPFNSTKWSSFILLIALREMYLSLRRFDSFCLVLKCIHILPLFML